MGIRKLIAKSANRERRARDEYRKFLQKGAFDNLPTTVRAGRSARSRDLKTNTKYTKVLSRIDPYNPNRDSIAERKTVRKIKKLRSSEAKSLRAHRKSLYYKRNRVYDLEGITEQMYRDGKITKGEYEKRMAHHRAERSRG